MRIRHAALLLVAVLLAVTTLSAFIRLANAGLGCDDWPACYGERLRAAQQGRPAADAPGVGAARFAHRVLGGVALLLVLVIGMASALTQPLLRRESAAAAALLALAFGLALLGVASAGAPVPAVTIGNLAGGFLMLALALRLAWPAPPRAAALRRWAALGALLLLVQVALGGLLSAGYGGLSCPAIAGCWPDAPAWGALDPFRQPVFEASTPPVNPPMALAQALHRGVAGLAAVLVVPLGVALWRRGARVDAAVVLTLLALQLALGAATVLSALALPPALLHNAGAALLFAAVARLA